MSSSKDFGSSANPKLKQLSPRLDSTRSETNIKMMRSVGLVLATVAMLASSVAGHNVPANHWSAAIPNFERLNTHGRKLSAACLAKGRSLDSTCPLDPEVTEGPYVWDEAPIRENITEGKPGVPFQIQLTVVNSTTCEEIEGAAVEFWHCDANGIYSHFYEQSTNTGSDTDNSTYLRGIQYTNASGTTVVDTIFPGWYEGRVTHIHIRVHFNITETDDGESYTGGTVSHVGQLFFNDTYTYEIQSASYYENNTASITALANDSVYTGQDGSYGLTTLTEMYPGEGLTKGVIGFVTVGIDTVETDSTSSGGGSVPSGSGPSMPSGGPDGNFTQGGSPPGTSTAPTTPTTGSPTMWPTNAPSSAMTLSSSLLMALGALFVFF